MMIGVQNCKIEQNQSKKRPAAGAKWSQIATEENASTTLETKKHHMLPIVFAPPIALNHIQIESLNLAPFSSRIREKTLHDATRVLVLSRCFSCSHFWLSGAVSPLLVEL